VALANLRGYLGLLRIKERRRFIQSKSERERKFVWNETP
jgi:hypothetical protein